MEKNLRQIASDPIRCALMARLCKKGTALLFALMMAAFYLIAYKLCGAMEGAAVIAACGVLGAVRLSKKAMKGRKWQMIRLMLLYIFRAFLMILLGALVLTLVITLVCSLLDASQDVMYLLVYGAVTVFMLVASFIASGRYVFAQAAFYNRSTEEISKQY